MTKNEIDWQNHLEGKRANRAKEAETHRSNVAQEQLGWSNLSETRRHNVKAEKNQFLADARRGSIDLQKMNKDYEIRSGQLELQQSELDETYRHNRSDEIIGAARVGTQAATDLFGEILKTIGSASGVQKAGTPPKTPKVK